MKTKFGWFLAAAALVTAVLSACGGQYYSVDYNGSKAMFEGAKDSYPAGKRVELKVDQVMDSRIEVRVDGELIPLSKKREPFCLIFEFIMPEHDVSVTYDLINDSIAYADPE